MNNIMLKDMLPSEKPRERFLKFGAENISNEELISIIIKTGTNSISVKKLAQSILLKVNDVSELKDYNINKFTEIYGVGEVKAITLLAAIELGRRVYYEKTLPLNVKLNNPEKIYEYFKYYLRNKKQEHFFCLYLDNKKNLIEKRLLFIGTLNMSIVHPREVFKYAYLNSAASIICIHNHPSGNIKPSSEDIEITKMLVRIGKIQNIRIIDHIIIGYSSYYSFYENNNILFN